MFEQGKRDEFVVKGKPCALPSNRVCRHFMHIYKQLRAATIGDTRVATTRIGDLLKIRIGHDNSSGLGASWFLDKVKGLHMACLRPLGASSIFVIWLHRFLSAIVWGMYRCHSHKVYVKPRSSGKRYTFECAKCKKTRVPHESCELASLSLEFSRRIRVFQGLTRKKATAKSTGR